MARPRRDGTDPRPAQRKRLTDLAVLHMKPGSVRYSVIDEGGPQGLRLVVHPTGKKVWKFLYSLQGRKRWYSIGSHDAVGLADARKRARQLAGDVASDRDPQAERSARRDADTFKHLAGRYCDEHAKKHNKSWKQSNDLISKYVLPKWGNLRAAQIARRDVKELVASITAPILANQVRHAVSAVFTWAVKQEVVAANPCSLVDANPTHSRERILSDQELPIFWKEFDSAGLITSTALKVLLLTGQRPGEVAHMRYEHIKQSWWEMPGKPVAELKWPGTKNSESHRVWLPPQVLELLAELTDDEPLSSGPVFGENAFSSNLAKAMRSICSMLGAERITPHDLRRTHGTMITRLRFGRDAMNRIQNHREGGIASVYDRHAYSDENKQVMEAVANKIMSLVTGNEASNVVQGGFRKIK
jgi:integrase